MAELSDLTTVNVRRALSGDVDGIDWVVRHFSPLLLTQARHRLSQRLQGLVEPEDLVNDVWLIALPRLRDIEMREGRATPVLVRFLSRTLLLHLSTLMKKYIAGKPLRREAEGDVDPLDDVPAAVTGVVTRSVRSEVQGRLHACIQALPPHYREVIVLRGIEQNSNEEVAAALGIEANTVAQRFKRAKEQLRDALPSDIRAMFDGLE